MSDQKVRKNSKTFGQNRKFGQKNSKNPKTA